MKKSITLLLTIVIALVGVRSLATVPAYDSSAQLANAQGDIANWMKYLPDDVFVAHVSIPGTHDTATAEGWESSTGPTYSTTQSATIDQQLAGGIRAFDFRPGIVGEDGDALWCNHGTDRTSLKLADAMAKLTNYLDAHPSEFFVIHLFRGNVYNATGDASIGVKLLGGLDSDQARETYNRLFDELFNNALSEYIIDYSPYLKVKDIRGKIVIFRRDRISFAHIEKAGNLSNWPADNEMWSADNYVTATNATNPGLKGSIFATDISSPDDEATLNIELESITNLFNHNCQQALPNDLMTAEGTYKPTWSMIFTSGAYAGENTKGYLKNAEYTNPHLTSLLNNAETSGPTGIVFSDWVLTDSHKYSTTTYSTQGIGLVSAIIENNFKYIGNYILDDELFASDPDSNVDLFEGKEYFLRNIATGQYLSAGADWGTHASVDGQGIRITPIYDNFQDTYQLKTTFRQGAVDNFIGSNCYVDNTEGNSFKAEYTGNGNIFYFTFLEGGVTKALTAETAANIYGIGTEYVVENREYTPGNTWQQWELITEAERINEAIASANPDNGIDMSYMIRGNRLHPNDGENDKWIFTSHGGTYWFTDYSAYNEIGGTNDWNDKELVYRAYNDKASGASKYTPWELKQTVTGLPAGVYKVTFQALTANVTLKTFTLNGVDVRGDIHAESDGTMSCATAVSKFRDNSIGNCIVSCNDFVITDGSLAILIEKEGTASATGFFFDNFTLTYYGPADMEAIEYAPMDEYDTLILPFDHDIPAGLDVYSAHGYTDQKTDYYVIELIASERIKANTPYVVRYDYTSNPTGEPYRFWGIADSSSETVYSNGILTGSLIATQVPVNAFQLRRLDDSGMAFVRVLENDAADTSLPAYRAYLSDTEDAAINAANSKISYIRFSLLPDDSTGIETISAASSLDPATQVDVYSLSGVMLRAATPFSQALNGLDHGFYIVRSASVTLKVAL